MTNNKMIYRKHHYSLSFVPFLTLLALAITITIPACKNNPLEEPKEDIVPVKTVPVEKKEIALPILTSGRLFPKTMIKLSFKVGGLISQIPVDEGDSVKKGQLLASLDLSETQAYQNQAKNACSKAQRDLQRVENLFKDRAATLEQLQDMRTAYEIAQSNLQITQFNLNHSQIIAPTPGKILKRLAEPGEMTGPGNPIFIFGATNDQWIIRAGISAPDIVRIKRHDPASITFDAYPNQPFSASVSEISSAIDPSSGTYEIELSIQPNDLTLAAGFVGKISIEPSDHQPFHIIPIDAIVEGEGHDGIVFTIKNNKAIKLNIKIAHIFPETVAVYSGLENIDTVVTSGAAYLRDGSHVTISH